MSGALEVLVKSEECFKAWSRRMEKCAKTIAKISKMTVRGNIRVVLGIQGELQLLCILAKFQMQQSCFFLARLHISFFNHRKSFRNNYNESCFQLGFEASITSTVHLYLKHHDSREISMYFL